MLADQPSDRAEEPHDESQHGSEDLSPGAAAFADYLEQRDAGAEPDIEDYCATHPQLATELRLMLRLWQGVE